MGIPWARTSPDIPVSAPVGALTRLCLGADDEIRTRDPHLGKEMELDRQDRSSPLSSLSPVSSSAQSAESAGLQ
jgi:hypothetical protein